MEIFQKFPGKLSKFAFFFLKNSYMLVRNM